MSKSIISDKLLELYHLFKSILDNKIIIERIKDDGFPIIFDILTNHMIISDYISIENKDFEVIMYLENDQLVVFDIVFVDEDYISNIDDTEFILAHGRKIYDNIHMIDDIINHTKLIKNEFEIK